MTKSRQGQLPRYRIRQRKARGYRRRGPGKREWVIQWEAFPGKWLTIGDKFTYRIQAERAIKQMVRT